MQPTPPQPHYPSRYRRPTQPLAQAMRVQMDDGARIATYVYGKLVDGASPVLLLHGNGEEHGIFGPTIDSLVDSGFAVVAIDSRAQGKSTRGSAKLTYELMAADAVAALDAVGVKQAHVLGFSDGGIEALLLARDWPERVASITALGANITPEGVVAEPSWDLDGAIAAHSAWASYWTDPGGPCEVRPMDVDRSLLSPTPDEAARTAELLQLMLDEPHIPASSLATISRPTTIMVGEWDCIAEYETAQIVRAIPHARLVVVPDAYHSLPKHEPDFVTRELMATIARV